MTADNVSRETFRQRGKAGMGRSPLTHFLALRSVGWGRSFAREQGAVGGHIRLTCDKDGREHVIRFDSPGEMYDFAAKVTASAQRWAEAMAARNRRDIGGPAKRGQL